jgi:signal transduction histidine kinase
MRHIFSGLRFRLWLLVVLTCAPLVILTVYKASGDRRRATSSWTQRSQRMLETASREEERLIGGTRQLLLALAKSAPVRMARPNACKALVDELFATDPRYANLGVATTNGEILASAITLGGKAGERDRAFFRTVLENGAFTIGDFPGGTIEGKPVIITGYPVLDSAGNPLAVVFASIDLNWVSRFGFDPGGQWPRGATWTELDSHGRIVLRYPGPKSWVGQPFPDKELLKQISAKSDGVASSDGQASGGVPMFYSFASTHSQLVQGGTTVLAGIPRQALFSNADQALFRNLLWTGLAAGLALVLGWIGSDFLVVRPVKALVRSSTQLATGDLTARTGLRHGHDELGRLTLAFDLMAQALQQRELERNRDTHKLQILSQRLVEVQETERRHIARELHDEIGQSLTVAEMNLQAALQGSEPAQSRRLEDSIKAVERVLEQVHDLSLNLRPSMLDDLGLEPALRWYTNRQADLIGLRARFRADPLERRVDPVIETECFRVAQEALTNVVRHSHAKSVAVELAKVDGHLHLRVRDDGVGFDVASQRDKAVRGASLGLLSMEERASLAGGGLELRSTPGKGTEIHAWFPLKWRAEQS